MVLGGKWREIEPEREAELRERDSRESRVMRNVETTVRFVARGTEERSMDQTLVALQEIPEKEHGFWLGSQLGRRVGVGREDLKLRSCWVSL